MLKKFFIKTDNLNFEISEKNELIANLLVFEQPSAKLLTSDVDNADGIQINDIIFEKRKGTLKFYARCADFYDSFLHDHELRRIFLQKKLMRVSCDANEHKEMLCYVESYKAERVNPRLLSVEVDLIAPYPYFRSRATSTETKSFDADAWQFGQNLQLDDMSYEHTAKSFAIYNASDITIDPRTHYLQATFVIKEAASFFRVTNRTTNEIVQINRAVAINDVVTLDGVNVYLNGQNIIADTNLELLTLAVGINEIELNTLAESAFDFYFYYI